MKVALYARVSTPDQDPELQLRELRSYCGRQGWEIAATYTNIISGTKSKRPDLDRLMTAALRRKSDAVCVWKPDRFGRSQEATTGTPACSCSQTEICSRWKRLRLSKGTRLFTRTWFGPRGVREGRWDRIN